MDDCVPDDVLLDEIQGRLGAVEARRVAAHLAVCQGCRAHRTDLEMLDATAAGHRPAPGREAEAQVLTAIRLASARLRAGQGRPGTILAHPLIRLAASAAVLLAVGIGTFAALRPRPVAHLIAARPGIVVHRGGAERPSFDGMPLYGDDAIEAGGDESAVVVLNDATRIEVGPRTELALGRDDAGRPSDLQLRSGYLEVEAARRPAGRPLRIRTPGARAEVLGTRFALAAASGRTSARVDAGRVRLIRGRDGASIDVPAGFRTLLSDRGRPVSAPTRTGTVLLIVSRQDAAPSWERFTQLMGTRLVGDRLRQLGLDVEVKDHHDVRPDDLADRPMIIVSHAEFGAGLRSSLKRLRLDEAPVPVICLEAVALPTMKMSGPEVGTDYQWHDPDLPLALREPSHALAAGLTDSSLDNVPCYGWAVPGPGAKSVVGLAHDARKAVAFGYETGDTMAGAVAPARRVGLLFDPDRMTEEADAAWQLFEDAVNWCASPEAAPATARHTIQCI